MRSMWVSRLQESESDYHISDISDKGMTGANDENGKDDETFSLRIKVRRF